MDFKTMHDAAYELMCVLNFKEDINPQYQKKEKKRPYMPLPLPKVVLQTLPSSSAIFEIISTPHESQLNTRVKPPTATEQKQEPKECSGSNSASQKGTRPKGPANGVQKSRVKPKKDDRSLAGRIEAAEMQKEAREIGPWSKLFHGREEAAELQHRIWQLVFRSSKIRRQECSKIGKGGREESKPKRSMNSFMLYRKTYQDAACAYFRNHHHQKISQLCGLAWSLEPVEVRATFSALAVFEHIALYEAFPDYVFQPMKNEEKGKMTGRVKKEQGHGVGLTANLSATTIRQLQRQPITARHFNQLAHRPPYGQSIGKLHHAAPKTMDVTYWRPPMAQLGTANRRPPTMDNYYIQSTGLSNSLSTPGVGLGYPQLPFDSTFINEFMAMGVKSESSLLDENAATILGSGSLSSMSGTHPYMQGTFPLIAQQFDGLTGGEFGTHLGDYGLVDDIKWEDYLHC
ncbi:uncharacterized protein B0I36DRAFT_386761 [Microdochium trichocladiopsis]|uniref:HMG box domain-containing protein n=1 Tax=Microdochium trichocladiopsis TaxID=1682393 RepID=A0A9P8Y3H9_9PEZI|nr:uncharacterized protein B0I36DRAFT_386761 [Microdochium trichocladiopsis]KAH7026512.1 hypothetical protein B0I36DRAFT_386761 [Microdochium trichocladiopsis]